jgi:hypothetical protein
MDAYYNNRINIEGDYLTYDQLRAYGENLFEKLESMIQRPNLMTQLQELKDEIDTYEMPSDPSPIIIEEVNDLFKRLEYMMANKKTATILNEIMSSNPIDEAINKFIYNCEDDGLLFEAIDEFLIDT